jgi:MoxR-like ATPase
LHAVCSTDEWLQAQRATEAVTVAAPVARFAIDLCRATRQAPGVRLGASPRAAIWLIRCAQAFAVMSGRAYVAPDDVKVVATACLVHRVLCDDGAGQAGQVVRSVLETTPTPRP